MTFGYLFVGIMLALKGSDGLDCAHGWTKNWTDPANPPNITCATGEDHCAVHTFIGNPPKEEGMYASEEPWL